MNTSALIGSPILADFGGIGLLIFFAFFAGWFVLSVGVAAFDHRRVQLVLAAASCVFFCLFCIEFVLAVLAIFGVVRLRHGPPFGLLLPPITAVQFILYVLRLRHRSQG